MSPTKRAMSDAYRERTITWEPHTKTWEFYLSHDVDAGTLMSRLRTQNITPVAIQDLKPGWIIRVADADTYPWYKFARRKASRSKAFS